MTQVTMGAATDPGIKKDENQDYYAYHIPESGSRKGILMALADGMGGRSGGSLASKIAVEVLMQEYYKDTSHSIPQALERAFHKANESVWSRGYNDIDLKGMATTLTAVVLKGSKAYFAHVGDSRGYIVSRNEISRFTQDHSFVAELVKAGQITEEEAESHPDANIITRAVGLDQAVKVDAPADPLRIQSGQYVMLCCDGVFKVLTDKDLLTTVNEFRAPEVISQKLIRKAIDRGTTDNVTVLIARVEKLGLKSRLLNLMR
jgi:protein phosphatase